MSAAARADDHSTIVNLDHHRKKSAEVVTETAYADETTVLRAWSADQLFSFSEASFLSQSNLLSTPPKERLYERDVKVSGASHDDDTTRAETRRVSDAVTREELTARLETIEAKADARFKEIMGEIRTSNAEIAGKIDVAAAKSAGKWTVWAAAGSIIVAMVATIIVLLQVMQTGYDTGRDAERALTEAASKLELRQAATTPTGPAPKS